NVVEPDLGVGQHSLQRVDTGVFPVARAVLDARAGDANHPHFQLVKFPRMGGRGLKAEDIDYLLLVQQAIDIDVQVVRVAEDLPSGRIGHQVERIVVRIDGRSLLQIVLHPDAGDVDG